MLSPHTEEAEKLQGQARQSHTSSLLEVFSLSLPKILPSCSGSSLHTNCNLLVQAKPTGLQVYLPTEALVAWCQEQKSGRRLGKNFKRRKDFLRELDMLPDGFPITWEDPLPDNLITATQASICLPPDIITPANWPEQKLASSLGRLFPRPSQLQELWSFGTIYTCLCFPWQIQDRRHTPPFACFSVSDEVAVENQQPVVPTYISTNLSCRSF